MTREVVIAALAAITTSRANLSHTSRVIVNRLIILAGVLLSGCGETEPALRTASAVVALEPAEPRDSVSFDYVRQSGNSERRLVLRPLGGVPLGQRADDAPTSVRDVVLGANTTFVLDANARQLRGYDAEGALRFAVGKWGTGEAEFDTPVALRLHHDTLVVLDLSHGDHLQLYGLDGRYLGAHAFSLEEGGTSVELLGRTMLFATLAGRRRGDRWYTAMAVDQHGRVQWSACLRDPQYDESERRVGAAGRYAFRALSRLDERFFCVQPLSPVVLIHDTTGRYLGASRRAPAVYRPAPHRPQTLNAREIQRFESEWTAHQAMYPTRTGFVSVYVQWDTTSGANRYLLFSCDSAQGPVRCGSTWTTHQPVRLLGEDTLLAVTRVEGGRPPRLARFHLRIDP